RVRPRRGGEPAEQEALLADTAQHRAGEVVLAALEAVTRAGDHESPERPGAGGVQRERVDERLGWAVEVLASTADDGRDGQADSAQRGPARVGAVIREDVL